MRGRLVLWSAVGAYLVVAMALILVGLGDPSGSGRAGQDEGGAEDDPAANPGTDEPWSEGGEDSRFMSDYDEMRVSGTRIYFQNLTVSNGTVNTTFEVDSRWFCYNVYIYLIGPDDPSVGDVYCEYQIAALEGIAGSGGNWNQSAEGGSGGTGYLYNEGPYGEWSFEITVLNGSAIVWIEGYQET